jgi:hypothetical protein
MRWRWSYAMRATAALALVLLAATVGCAHPSTSSGGQGDQTRPDSTSSNTPSPGAAAGGVKITLAQARFRLQEPIVATIQNGLTTSIWTTDHHADCGLLTLEYFTGGAWRAVGQCSQPRPVKVVEIAAGVSAPQSIGYAQNMDMGSGWSAGTYRLSLSYAPNQSQAKASGATTVHSDAFTVE